MTFANPAIIYAFLGGLLPALLWLWFWHREDRRHPEPGRLIALAFLGGMLAVPLVVPFERTVAGIASGALLILLWAVIEECFKFGAAYLTVLRRKELDEPIDATIYMITVALGFAALENTFFLLNPIGTGSIVDSIVTGNFRFFGATLLHTVASATVGVFMALSFYKPLWVKRITALWGVILAVALHALFNLSIMKAKGGSTLFVFLFVWLGIILLMLVFEKIKRLRSPRSIVRK